VVSQRNPVDAYAALAALPEHQVGEVLGGTLHVQPRPASPHARAASRLGIALGSAFYRGIGGPGGWVILDEPELHLDDDVLVPDLAGWRRERMPEEEDVPFFTLAPDWVCEVSSPTTRRVDRVLKLPIYARAGVGHVWLVEPIDQLIEVFRREGARWTLVTTVTGTEPPALEPFEAVPLDLAFLWGR
jgi:Uma2 family endonuclease